MGGWLQFGTTSWLGVSGAIWDIAGAVILSRGYLWATDEGIRREKASAWGMNPGAARAAAEERRNQRFGLRLIIAGFALQGASNFGVITNFAGLCVLVGLLVLTVWTYLVNFQYITVRDGLRIGVTPDSVEWVWRKHHTDVPDRVWYAIICNEEIVFADEPKDPSL